MTIYVSCVLSIESHFMNHSYSDDITVFYPTLIILPHAEVYTVGWSCMWVGCTCGLACMIMTVNLSWSCTLVGFA